MQSLCFFLFIHHFIHLLVFFRKWQTLTWRNEYCCICVSFSCIRFAVNRPFLFHSLHSLHSWSSDDTHTHTSICPLAPLTDLYCCTIGNPHNTQIHHQPPTIPESPKRAADVHPSRTASDNCSLSLQINIHQEQQNTLMWSRVQTDTQQSPLHVQHTQSTAALASFSTQTHVVVHLRCLSYLWHVQSGCFYCFNQSAAIKQPAKT